MHQFSYLKISGTYQNISLLLFDDPGRHRSQIINDVCPTQRFDFECNLVVTRKVIIEIPPPLRLKSHVDSLSEIDLLKI
jgi:hypothetical protein